ncbi:MAG: hypothetical protein QXL96_08765 [Ignisphaera sp.]
MENLCSENILKMFEGYDRILEALAKKRFVVLSSQGLVVYVFKGVKRDYIVSPCKLCTCDDFVINYIGKSRSTPCYHVIGFEIAEKQNKLVKVELDYSTLAKVVEEIIFEGVSIMLRKLLR